MQKNCPSGAFINRCKWSVTGLWTDPTAEVSVSQCQLIATSHDIDLETLNTKLYIDDIWSDIELR